MWARRKMLGYAKDSFLQIMQGFLEASAQMYTCIMKRLRREVTGDRSLVTWQAIILLRNHDVVNVKVYRTQSMTNMLQKRSFTLQTIS
jgi:hypothetical protein